MIDRGVRIRACESSNENRHHVCGEECLQLHASLVEQANGDTRRESEDLRLERVGFEMANTTIDSCP